MAARTLEVTKDNWRKTGVTLGRGVVGKTDRIPATGQNLDKVRAFYDRADWKQPFCATCLRDPADCICPAASAVA